jgi:hypothetical protein
MVKSRSIVPVKQSFEKQGSFTIIYKPTAKQSNLDTSLKPNETPSVTRTSSFFMSPRDIGPILTNRDKNRTSVLK